MASEAKLPTVPIVRTAIRSFLQATPPPDFHRSERLIAPGDARSVTARIADGEGPTGLERRKHHVPKFQLVHRRSHRQIGNRTEIGQIESAVMRRSVLTHQTAPVKTHDHRKALDRHVMNHIVISPLHETRIDVAERHHARSRQSGGESHGMSFGDTDVETTLRHLFHQNIHRAARRHGGRYPHDPLVGTGQFEQRLAENILVSGHFGLADDPLARFRVEFARSVPYRLIALGGLITLSFTVITCSNLGPSIRCKAVSTRTSSGKLCPSIGPK